MLITSNRSWGEYNVSKVSPFATAQLMTLAVARSSSSPNDFRCPATTTPNTRGGGGGRPLTVSPRPRALRTRPRALRSAAFRASTTPNKSRTTAATHGRIVSCLLCFICLTGHRWSNVGVHPTFVQPTLARRSRGPIPTEFSKFLSPFSFFVSFFLSFFINIPQSTIEMRCLVYRGPGASTRSVTSTVESLRRALARHRQHTDFTVTTATPADLLSSDDEWEATTSLLAFPGGADVPYCNSLGAVGMERVRRYVESGGRYLGICAGAYFASGAVSFEPGTELEVVGERHLKFYRGVAAGAAYSGFDYESERGAVSAPIRFVSSVGGSDWETCLDYVNGGPLWMMDDIDDTSVFRINSVNHSRLEGVDILATYVDLKHAVAAMRCRVGRGVAVLCGSHPELHHSLIADIDSGDDPVYAEHVQRLKENLSEHEAGRKKLFDLCVDAAIQPQTKSDGFRSTQRM